MKIFCLVLLLLFSTAYSKPLFPKITSTSESKASQQGWNEFLNDFIGFSVKFPQCFIQKSGFGPQPHTSDKAITKGTFLDRFGHIVESMRDCLRSIREVSHIPTRIESKENHQTINFRDFGEIQTTSSSIWLLKELLLN